MGKSLSAWYLIKTQFEILGDDIKFKTEIEQVAT